jgi:phage terminase large subunit GpA-like protein
MSARDLPSHLLRADILLAEVLRDYFLPPPRQTVTKWAEANRVLSSKDSSEPGQYRVSRTPYAQEPQDALSAHSQVREVVLMWGAQTSKSTVGMNWIGSVIDLKPGPTMVVQPTLDMAKRFSGQRLAPMIFESDALRRKVSDNKSRDEQNTKLLKEFAGGFLAIAGANSAAGLRSMPVCNLMLDEVDAYPFDVDGEGDPITLARARQTTFPRAKTLQTSTPTLADQSRIEAAYLASDQRQYHVPCPHCGERQQLVWGAKTAYGLKWRKDDSGNPLPKTAHYVCRHCAAEIDEHHKPYMLSNGLWVPQNPSAPAHVRGYHLSSIYSPLGWLSWAALVQEWLAATTAQKIDNLGPLQTFINTRLAETYKPEGRGSDAQLLRARAEPYKVGQAPRGALMLVMGVDTQPDRLEARTWAYGRGQESWLVERHIIYGDPNIAEGEPGSPWTRLTEVRRALVPHECGGNMLIEAVGIDTGGHNTQAVYAYARAHHHAGVLALKGASRGKQQVLSKPSAQEVNWRGTKVRSGVQLRLVGTDTVKDLLMGRINIGNAGSGYVHLPNTYNTSDEYEQMTAERLLPHTINGQRQMRWTLPAGKRNEALDCWVYAYAAAVYLGLNSMGEGSWSRREAKYAPRERSLFDDTNPAVVPSSIEFVAKTMNPPTPVKASQYPRARTPQSVSW